MAPHVMTGVALITGAASGIGRSVAETFVSEGVTRLILADLNLSGLHETAAMLKKSGGDPAVETVCVETDTSDEASVERMVSEGVERFGAIHYAVNNAGVTSRPRVRTHELPVDMWDRVERVNLRGVWLCERAELTQMMRQERSLKMRTGAPGQRGAIVNISSLFGVMSHPTCGAYAASKAGVLGISRTDAAAYAIDGIRVNSVCPGFIKTPLVEQALANGADYSKLLSSVPLGRWGLPEEIAEAVVFLAGERASLITGEELIVDGGFFRASEAYHGS